MVELWAHQNEMVNFVRDRNSLGFNGVLLAADVRTGKTLAAIEYAKDFEKVLVVCPHSIQYVWKDHFDKFLPDIDYLLPVGTVKERATCAALSKSQFIVLNYEAAWRQPLANILVRKGFDLCILDECHRIKGAGSKVSRFFSRLGDKIPYRLGLTATPFRNSKLDVYGQYRFLDKKIFGTNNQKFRDRYVIMGGYSGYETVAWVNKKEFEKRFNLIAYRLKADDVLTLPPVQDIVYHCKLESNVRKFYNKLESDYVADFNKMEFDATSILTKMMRLQQVAGGHIKNTDEPTQQISKAKMALLLDVVDSFGDAPLVVYFRFSDEIKTATQALNKIGITTSEMSGKTKQIKEWMNDKTQVLLAQVQTASEGVNLSRSSVEIFYSMVWDWSTFIQARGRIRSPDQKANTVTYIYLQAADTIDEDIYDNIMGKDKDLRSLMNRMTNRYGI